MSLRHDRRACTAPNVRANKERCHGGGGLKREPKRPRLKQFLVYIDGVTEIVVEASSEEEAKEKAYTSPKEWHDLNIYQIEEVE